MKKIFFIILLLPLNSAFSQERNFNWLFFIDGHIVNHVTFVGEFVFDKGTENEKRIKFDYVPGNISISSEDYEYVTRKIQKDNTITMCIRYKEFNKYSVTTYIYSVEIEPRMLFFDYAYVIFQIDNLNKRKGTFWFRYMTDYESSPGLKNSSKIFYPNHFYPTRASMKVQTKPMRRIITPDEK